MLFEVKEFSWITGFYWTLTVMSTLGFGDITFATDLGRIYSIIVLMSGIVFLLTMRNLGNLRIDTRVTDKKMQCVIQVDNREIAGFVERNLQEISQRLGGLGYRVEKLSCMVEKPDTEKIVPLEGFSLLEMRLVDIVA